MRASLTVAAAALIVAATLPAAGQDRTLEQFACKDVIRDRDSNRDVAIAFLHGYLLGKTGGSKFDLEVLQQQSGAFIDRCLNNPNEKALDAMGKVKP